MSHNWRIRKGDEVVVISGKEKGKTGKVVKVVKSKSRLYVGGINLVKKHQKPSAANPSGGIIEKEASLNPCGTVENTSPRILMIKGKIIMARIIPPASVL